MHSLPIPQLSVLIFGNGTYAQQGEKSRFTDESRSTSSPCTHTRIEENSQSPMRINCLTLQPSPFMHCIEDN